MFPLARILRCEVGALSEFLDNSTVSRHSRKFLTEAEERGEVVDVSGSLPKSFVLTEEFGMRRVYLSQYYSSVLEKRLD